MERQREPYRLKGWDVSGMVLWNKWMSTKGEREAGGGCYAKLKNSMEKKYNHAYYC